MKKLSILVSGTIASIFMLGSTVEAQAQQPQAPQQQAPANSEGSSINVDQQELERFANAFKSVQKIQSESRQKIAQAIKDEGLTIEEFNQMFRAQQQSETAESEMSSEKQQQFQQVNARIEEIDQQAQNDIENAITNQGMEMQRFETIWKSVQQDKQLQQQVRQILQN